jgi:ATP-binding cassette subfamily B protein
MGRQHYPSVYAFLWDMIRPYKWHYAIMLLAPILGAFYDFANTYVLKMVVDAFSQSDNIEFEAFYWPIGLFIFAQIYLDVVWRVSDIAEWRSEPYVRQKILTNVYDRVQHAPFHYFQNVQTGSITSKIKGMLDGYDNFWAAMHHDFTPRIANTIVLTATLAVVNVKVCLGVALWSVIFFVIMRKFSLSLDRLSFVAGTHRHGILGFISDNVTNIGTILSFATRAFELKRLNHRIESDFIPANIRVYKVSFYSNLVAAFLYWIMLISLFIYMIHLRQTGQASSGDIVFVMTITLKIAWELWLVIQKMQVFMKNIGEFKAAFSIMDIPRDEPADKRPNLEIQNPSVAFEQISFGYATERKILSDLSLSIRAGEKIGLVGVSGSGKSTLIALLLRNFVPLTGHIVIDGQDISKMAIDSVRKHIAIIPQDIMLFHRSIYDNITYGRLNATEEEVIAAARIANIHDHIESLPDGYKTMVGERGIKLSGGQRQRIAIARAILKNAPILVLDEATSSLDTQTEHMIKTSIERILHKSSTTVIAIAHRLSTIKHMDRIIVLEKGQIMAQGSHEMLLQSSDLYKSLWEMQKV